MTSRDRYSCKDIPGSDNDKNILDGASDKDNAKAKTNAVTKTVQTVSMTL